MVNIHRGPSQSTPSTTKSKKTHNTSQSAPKTPSNSLPAETNLNSPMASSIKDDSSFESKNGKALQALSLDLSHDFNHNIMDLPDFGISKHDQITPYLQTGEEWGEMDLFNPRLSGDKALFSLKVKPDLEAYNQTQSQQPFGSPDFTVPLKSPKLRSPYFKQKLREMGDTLIRNPLDAAWENKDFTSPVSLKAIGWGTGLLTAALLAPIDTRSSLRLGDKDIGKFNLGLKTRISSGHGKVDFDSVSLNFHSKEQPTQTRWNLDLKYKAQDDRFSLLYAKPLTKPGGEHFADFHAELFHGDKETLNRWGGSSKTERETGFRFGFQTRF